MGLLGAFFGKINEASQEYKRLKEKYAYYSEEDLKYVLSSPNSSQLEITAAYQALKFMYNFFPDNDLIDIVYNTYTSKWQQSAAYQNLKARGKLPHKK